MDESSIEFSVITPSFNMAGYLKRCCASVADQDGVVCEHIVMDGGSSDGSAEWLAAQEGIIGVVEDDNGMYDAVNKGFGRAKGEILSYLNCDEQYLPGTLCAVSEYFGRHPEVDILFGDALLIRPGGSLISYRKAYQPRWSFIVASHLYTLSCTMFMRRRIIDDGFRFDERLKDIGDQDLVVRILRSGYRAGHVKRYLAAFAMTGANMSAGKNAFQERKRALRDAPLWVRMLRVPLNLARWSEKLLSGAYHQKMPLSYSVYDCDEAVARKQFTVEKASFRWRAD